MNGVHTENLLFSLSVYTRSSDSPWTTEESGVKIAGFCETTAPATKQCTTFDFSEELPNILSLAHLFCDEGNSTYWVNLFYANGMMMKEGG